MTASGSRFRGTRDLCKINCHDRKEKSCQATRERQAKLTLHSLNTFSLIIARSKHTVQILTKSIDIATNLQRTSMNFLQLTGQQGQYFNNSPFNYSFMKIVRDHNNLYITTGRYKQYFINSSHLFDILLNQRDPNVIY